MSYLKNAFNLIDNYFIARLRNKASTAQFWYLPEPPTINSPSDLIAYQNTKQSPTYLIDYTQKLRYSLQNSDGIIVLPYQQNIGNQINPEAAFQYTLGLHDQFIKTNETQYLKQFWHYIDYFVRHQTIDGLWHYHFDWYESKAPWFSALAQARGASVMLRAWLLSNETKYLDAAKLALATFNTPIAQGGCLHTFAQGNCPYFEEYPQSPTGVINGFMSTLMSIWELNYWVKEKWLNDLWQRGLSSLEIMLPFYTTHWWSLYDLDINTPILNVNSPRYHLLEIHYLKILSVLSNSDNIKTILQRRIDQYNRWSSRQCAIGLKLLRKIMYR